MLHLILCSVVLIAGFLTTGLAVVIIGIHRSEHGKRLTSRPDGLSETIARRLLVGSRGCRPATPRTARDKQDDRPHRRRDCHRPALHRTRLRQVPRPLSLAPPQGVALPQVPDPYRPRPEEVM